MFLATTALEEFWNKEENLFFLGPWCLPYENRSKWNSLNYTVLPSLWDDRDLWHSTTNYLENRYEELIGDITQYLNSVHGVSHKSRYWRILLGPWLRRYLHTVYDRYCHLKEAFQRHPDLETYVLDPLDFKTVADTAEFSELVRSDEYNLMLFSQILRAQGHKFPVRRLGRSWNQSRNMAEVRQTTLPRRVLRSGKRALNSLVVRATAIVIKSPTIALCVMYLTTSEVWRLALRSRLTAAPLRLEGSWSYPAPTPSNSEARNRLANLPSPDDFSRIFAKTLPANFPTLYLEGYKSAKDDTLKRYPKFPKVLTSLTGWYFDEHFKFLAAEASEIGTRLVAFQHGGAYGFLEYVPEEFHETSISDSYMVWGWANGSNNQRNLPSPKLAPSIGIHRSNSKHDSKDRVLFVTIAGPQYLLRFISMPVGAQLEEYFDWGLRFIEANTQTTRQKIIWRPLHIDYGWGVKKRVTDKFPNVEWDDGRPYRDRLKSSRVVVLDNPITTFLEALIANVPTILFWDRELWEVRTAAEPYCENLRQAGILWDNPEEAASKLESIYDDPWAWWGKKEVQETRERFVKQYALSSKNWASHFARALKEEESLYQAANA